MWIIHLATVLAAAAPSGDEVMGFVIVFGLMFLCFLIARLFGPEHLRAPEVSYGIANKGPVSTVIGILVILGVFYVVGRVLVAAHR